MESPDNALLSPTIAAAEQETFGDNVHAEFTNNQSPRSNNSQGTIHNTQASISLVNGEMTERAMDHMNKQGIHERAISVNYRKGTVQA